MRHGAWCSRPRVHPGAPWRGAAPHLASLAERLGVVQIDSVNALVRSHYLPFFSRLGGYDAAALDALAWSGGRQRRFFEYWGHEASLLPLSFYPLMRWRMARSAAGQGIYAMLARFGRERQDVIQRVLQAIRTDGASGAGALSTRTERAGPGGTGATRRTRWSGCSPLAR